MAHLIAPSMLASDFGNLAAECKMVNSSEADWFHLDIMDGSFVPNISYGFPIVKTIKKYSEKPLDVHLMIDNPDKYIEEFRQAGANLLTVHYEACTHLHRTLQAIRGASMSPGLAINPHTPVASIKDVARECYTVLLMSVNPGFGGQAFIRQTYSRLQDLVALRAATRSDFLIEIDGGVGLNNAGQLLDLGADVLVAGSSVFQSENPNKTIAKLKALKPIKIT